MKVIALTQGYITVVSNDDYKKIKKYKWCITRSAGRTRKAGEPYACTYIKGKKIYLHRFLMNSPEGLIVDHINHQTLDNRRENLRVVTHSENMKNRIKWYKIRNRK